MKQKIQVYVRIRPLNIEEKKLNEQEVMITEGNTIKLNIEDISRLSAKSTVSKIFDRQKRFEFESIFSANDTTEVIYHTAVNDIILKSMKGINSTIFVYGQTGSGKTYTMSGEYLSSSQNHYMDQVNRLKSKSPLRSTRLNMSRSPLTKRSTKLSESKSQVLTIRQQQSAPIFETSGSEGLVTMSLRCIFQEIEAAEHRGEEFILNCSYIEIYNEVIYDLLRDFKTAGEQALQIFEDTDKGEFNVKGTIEECVTNYQDAIEILERGDRNRHFAATNLNHNSSRSHAIFRMFIKYVNKDGDIFQSVCNFVDLAGSEKLSKYQDENNKIEPERIKESKSINKSLFFLTQIINYKSTMKNDNFVPYRNSPLTKILKSSIGGNAKTAIILCVNPANNNIEQTINTLKFGNLASRIENTVQRNTMEVNQQDLTYKNALKCYQTRLQELDTLIVSIGKSDEYSARIKILEQQKLALQKKYDNLLRLCTKASKIEDIEDLYKFEVYTEHLSTCGAVERYAIGRGSQFSIKSKHDMHKSSFYKANADRNVGLFDKEIMEAKQLKLMKLEHENVILKQSLLSTERTSCRLSYDLDLCKRLLLILLNNNKEDLQRFDNEYKEHFISNSLLLIENCKTEQINNLFNLDEKTYAVLPYKQNSEPLTDLKALLKNFASLLNSESSFVTEDIISIKSESQVLPFETHDQNKKSVKRFEKDITFSNGKMSRVDLQTDIEKTMKASYKVSSLD